MNGLVHARPVFRIKRESDLCRPLQTPALTRRFRLEPSPTNTLWVKLSVFSIPLSLADDLFVTTQCQDEVSTRRSFHLSDDEILGTEFWDQPISENESVRPIGLRFPLHTHPHDRIRFGHVSFPFCVKSYTTPIIKSIYNYLVCANMLHTTPIDHSWVYLPVLVLLETARARSGTLSLIG